MYLMTKGRSLNHREKSPLQELTNSSSEYINQLFFFSPPSALLMLLQEASNSTASTEFSEIVMKVTPSVKSLIFLMVHFCAQT